MTFDKSNEAWADIFQDPGYLQLTLFEVKQHKKYYVTFCVETGIDGSLIRLQVKDGSGLIVGSSALQVISKAIQDLFPEHVSLKKEDEPHG